MWIAEEHFSGKSVVNFLINFQRGSVGWANIRPQCTKVMDQLLSRRVLRATAATYAGKWAKPSPELSKDGATGIAGQGRPLKHTHTYTHAHTHAHTNTHLRRNLLCLFFFKNMQQNAKCETIKIIHAQWQSIKYFLWFEFLAAFPVFSPNFSDGTVGRQ